MSAVGTESAGEREISRISLNAEREYLGAVLAFLREATGRLGLAAPDVAGLEHAVEEVCLDLPLSHPGARQSCAPLEALGFFFAGIIPDIADDDVLRLQYLNEVEAEVESAQIASDFGEELFAYVVRAMETRP